MPLQFIDRLDKYSRRTIALCIAGVWASLFSMLCALAMGDDSWLLGVIQIHLGVNSMSMGLSCSAVLLICYNWKTAEFVVTKKKAIVVFAFMYALASILGYVFHWFDWAWVFFFLPLFVVICLLCGVFFTFCSLKLSRWQASLAAQSRQIMGVLLAIVIVLLLFASLFGLG